MNLVPASFLFYSIPGTAFRCSEVRLVSWRHLHTVKRMGFPCVSRRLIPTA